MLSSETRNSIDTEHIDRCSSFLCHNKSLKKVNGVPGITNIHVNTALKAMKQMSSEKT
jgi:hypothetical protein